jgi:hypothetical protein
LIKDEDLQKMLFFDFYLVKTDELSVSNYYDKRICNDLDNVIAPGRGNAAAIDIDQNGISHLPPPYNHYSTFPMFIVLTFIKLLHYLNNM